MEEAKRALELPPAAQELLLKLQSSPLRSICLKDLQGPGFHCLFTDNEFDAERGTLPPEQAAHMRLLLFTAIGSCPTLESVDLEDSGELLRLTTQELEALLKGLKTSQVLSELDLSRSLFLQTEPGCKLMGDFLGEYRRLEVLKLYCSIPSRKGMSYILQKLLDTANPLLRVLSIKIGSSKKLVDEVARILSACPGLQELDTLDNGWRCRDEATSHKWAELLVQHGSLSVLKIEGTPDGLSAFLDVAFKGPHPKNSLKKLYITVQRQQNNEYVEAIVEGLLLSTVLANKELELLHLDNVAASTEEWREVCSALQQTHVLKHLHLTVGVEVGFDERTWNEWAELLGACLPLETLSLAKDSRNLQDCDLQGLFQALSSSSKLKGLRLSGFKVDREGASALASFIEGDDVLEELAVTESEVSNFDDVFHAFRKNTKLKYLDLSDVKGLDQWALKELLGALKVNSSLQHINAYLTSWWDDAKLMELINNGLQRKHVIEEELMAMFSQFNQIEGSVG